MAVSGPCPGSLVAETGSKLLQQDGVSGKQVAAIPELRDNAADSIGGGDTI